MVQDTFTVQDKHGWQAFYVNSYERLVAGHAIRSGCGVSINTGTLGSGNNALSVASGTALVDRASHSVASQNVDIRAGDADPRWDVVAVDNTGSVVVVEGAAEPAQIGGEATSKTHRDVERPAPPDLSGQAVTPLALVWVGANNTSIDNADLFDMRVPGDLFLGDVTLAGDLTDEAGNVVFDFTNNWVPEAILENNSVTVAGNTVSLGNSTAVAHADLSTIGATDHHTTIQMSDSGTAVLTQPSDINFGANLSVTDDGDGTITVDGASDTDTRTDVSDGGTLVVSDVTDINMSTNLSVTDDGDGSVTVDASGGGGTTLASHDTYVIDNGDGTYSVYTSDGTKVNDYNSGMVAIQAGVDNAPADGSIYVRGSYTYSSSANQVTVGGGKTLVGYDADITNSVTAADVTNNVDTAPIVLASGSEGTAVSVTADATQGTNYVTVNDTTSFSVGDIVRLHSTETYSASGAKDMGELLKIWDIDGTNSKLYFTEPISFDYDQVNFTVDATPLTMDEGHVEGLTITGQGITSNQWGIHCILGENCTMDNIVIEEIGLKVTNVEDCYNCALINSRIERCDVNGDGYGIRVRNATALTRVENNEFYTVRHAVAHSGETSNGRPKGTFVKGNICTGTRNGSCIDAHEGTINWTVEGNWIFPNQAYAIQDGCRESYIRNNTCMPMRDDNDPEGGFWQARSGHDWDETNHISTGNNIYRIQNRRAWMFDVQNGAYESIIIRDNTVYEPEKQVIDLREDTDRFVFANNVVDYGNNAANGYITLWLGDSGHTPAFDSIVVQGNEFQKPRREVVYSPSGDIGSCDHYVIKDNFVSRPNTADEVFLVGQATNALIQDNDLFDPNGNASPFIELGSGVSGALLDGNTMDGGGTFLVDNTGATNYTPNDNFETGGTGGWTAANL